MVHLLRIKENLDAEIEIAQDEIKLLQQPDDQQMAATPRARGYFELPGDDEAMDDNDPLAQEITSLFKNVKPEVLEFATSIMRSAVDEL